MTRDVMTPEQVAQYLQIDRGAVYRLIRDRELAATRIGRTYRIPRDDVETFLLARSSRPEVRAALFDRALAHAERENPGSDSDVILEELERMDEDRRRRAAS